MSKQGENTTNKNNILSMENLKQRHEDTFKMSEAYVSIDDDEMLSYKVYEVFPNSKKQEYIKDILEFVVKTVTEPDYQDLVSSITNYTLISVIDKFTDIEVPEDDKEKIIYAGYLADFDILGPIINSLNDEEVKKVMQEAEEAIYSHTERMKDIAKQHGNNSGDVEDLSSLRLVEKELEEDE